MREILKLVHMDFISAKPIGLTTYIIVSFMFSILALLFSPIVSAFIILFSLIMVFPVQVQDTKNDFRKLYGILPVNRKNITLARFIYFFACFFVSEIISIIVSVLSFFIKLYRIFPDTTQGFMLFIKDNFEKPDYPLCFVIIAIVFAVFCIFFSYMEMMGQIFGREKEIKTVLITILVLFIPVLLFFKLSDMDIIPTFSMPSLPETIPGALLFMIIINIAVFGICMIFSKITTGKIIIREF